MITEELKERLIADYPKFEDMTRKFYKKEMSIADYKGQSGAYGSYAERGAATGMSQVGVLTCGRIKQEQMRFLADTIRKVQSYNIFILQPVNACKCMDSMGKLFYSSSKNVMNMAFIIAVQVAIIQM